ncbi:calcium/proton exchanger [Tumidithrix helvetica]|uniref:calcium/proton exchanger n=1 Tax=Tumidithrix helvetica TaxID=3457545 RepID=UPI003CC51231
MPMRKLIPLIPLVFVPISIAADQLAWGDTAVFFTSALAIIAVSIWLSTATEKIAVVMGPSIGGLVNAVFGNATQLIVALTALRAGLIDIVRASITGSILCDLLLLLGIAMVAGGLRYKEQSFQSIWMRVNGLSMLLAVVAIALPTLVISTSNIVDASAIRNLSTITAAVLILVYGLTLLFSLKTHSYLYEVGLAEAETESVEEHAHAPKVAFWVIVLLVSTIAIAIESELFVGVVEAETAQLALTPLFTGVVLLPFVGDMAGYVTVIRLSLKNKMDLTVATTTGDSLLVALFIAPVLVFVGQAIGQPLDLNFNPFEVSSLTIAVIVANLIGFGGRSNWLDGTLLIATYFILGVAFYYHPA